MKKFIIKSISDLITNSSSEVFCIITHPDRDTLEQIYKDLYDIFDCDRQEPEETPCLYEKNTQVIFELPYSKMEYSTAFKGAIETWLNENYNNYETEYYYDEI